MNILHINVTYQFGSTGKIVKSMHEMLTKEGHHSKVIYGRNYESNDNDIIKIGNQVSYQLHGLKTRFLDRHGFGSYLDTKRLLSHIHLNTFDIIHIHNIHGYYIHVGLLFEALKQSGKKIIWTLHDSWSYTGHCAYYDAVGCMKWIDGCHHCPQKHSYPQSIVLDQSKKNYKDKKQIFNGLKDLTLVTPSDWLRHDVEKSFLKDYNIQTIHNGIDLSQFKPLKHKSNERFTILGIASIWEKRKGLDAFIELSKTLSDDIDIILIGKLMKGTKLPLRIKHITRTENIQELVHYYNLADVMINPTIEDNLPTTSIEALACGTPVITYDTGGSKEIVDDTCGFVIPKYHIHAMMDAIYEVKNKGKLFYQTKAVKKASYFKAERMRDAYMALYKEVLKQ